MNHFVHTVEQYIRQHRLLQSGDRILATVSGGVDSVVMLDVLLSLKDRWNLTVAVAHFNHQLRGEESDADEAFVRQLCSERNLECFVEHADTHSVARDQRKSIQAAARDLRYEFFATVRSKHGFTKIATAHNADDNAETLLLNLIRGAGVRGLSGIPVLRSDLNVIRPLLGTSRSEIELYAKHRSLTFRTDSSNLHDHYARNFVRHAVLPLLKNHLNPNLTSTLNRTAALFRDLDAFVVNTTSEVLKNVIEKETPEWLILKIEELQKLPSYLQEYSLLIASQRFAQGEVDFSSVRSLMNLTVAETGSLYSLTKDCIVVRDRNRLVFRRSGGEIPFSYRIEANKLYQFDRFWFASSPSDSFQKIDNGLIEFVDADRLGNNLVLRNWKEGDWFYPLGMEGKKKLSDFFIDAKIPIYEKHSIPVLEADGSIVWVCGRRIDHRFRVSESTRHILKLEYLPRIPA